MRSNLKIAIFLLCKIILCCITISKANAVVDHAKFLKEYYYEAYPELFKEFEHHGKKVIVNKIANMPEILNCGTPVNKTRIIKLINEMHSLFARLEITFQDIKMFKKIYFSYNDDANEIVKSNIHIDAAKDMSAKFSEFNPITINEIIASLSVISDYIGSSQINISEYLKEISIRTQGIQDGLNKATESSVTGFLQKTSIQALLNQTSSLHAEQSKLLLLLKELNSIQTVVQNASHLLTDFYLQTRSAGGAGACSTDLYLSYLNVSIANSDALALTGS